MPTVVTNPNPPIDDAVVSDDPNWVSPAKQLAQSIIDGSAYLTSLQAQFPGCVIVVCSSMQLDQRTVDWDLSADIAQGSISVGQRSQDLWAMLHEYPRDNELTWVPSTAQSWYENTWLPEVALIATQSSGVCGCSAEWARSVELSPPNYSSAKEFALWAWQQHLNVSRSLTDHQFANYSWADAVAEWSYPSGWAA